MTCRAVRYYSAVYISLHVPSGGPRWCRRKKENLSCNWFVLWYISFIIPDWMQRTRPSWGFCDFQERSNRCELKNWFFSKGLKDLKPLVAGHCREICVLPYSKPSLILFLCMVHAAVFFASVDEQHQIFQSVLGLLVAASGHCLTGSVSVKTTILLWQVICCYYVLTVYTTVGFG